ncbi:MAG TPA: glycosyltransferase family 39 protein [Bryobacteraceae bacterium]|nr:glycosyltransferase family 39 protein [Bryobacteraceae bacterium]
MTSVNAVVESRRLESAWTIGSVFLIAALLAFAVASFAPRALVLDSDYAAFYGPVARSLIERGDLAYDNGALATRYPPGYPLLLAAFYTVTRWFALPDMYAPIAINVVAAGLSALFLYLTAALFFGRIAAVVTFALWCSYPVLLPLLASPSPEPAFLAVLYAAVWMTATGLRSRRSPLFFFAGLLVGAAMLIKPIAIGFGLLLATAAWFWAGPVSLRTRLKLPMLVLLGNAVLVIPWQGLVLWRTGEFILLSTGAVPSIRDGLTFSVHPEKSFQPALPVPEDVSFVERAFLVRYEHLESVGSIASAVAAEFRDHPTAMCKLFGLKSVRAWYGTDSGRRERVIGPIQAAYLIVCWMAMISLIRARGESRRLAFSVCVAAGYFWAATVSSLSIVRYMIPVMGFLFVLAAAHGRRFALRFS